MDSYSLLNKAMLIQKPYHGGAMVERVFLVSTASADTFCVLSCETQRCSLRVVYVYMRKRDVCDQQLRPKPLSSRHFT